MRATVMPVVSAAGCLRPPIFVFRGKILTYRQVSIDGRICVQTYADYLPRTACIEMREESCGVDSANLCSWAKKVVTYVSDLTKNGMKLLLTYDDYAEHMSFRVLELFKASKIDVYALPSHTSVKT